MQITYQEMFETFRDILIKFGFNNLKAEKCSRIFTDNSQDGVYSHGVNRFPRFVEYLKKGYIKPAAEPELSAGYGVLEQWNGNLGPGPLNADFAIKRAIELSKQHLIGAVTLSNTNHWMRGGTYGWQAANAGCLAICFTNTIPNMPPWGGTEDRLGNNPLVIAVPRKNGPVVLDMAMTQFSYGSVGNYKMKKQMLPVPGGFDAGGNLCVDPALIRKMLPTGFWKGSGLSLMLDIFLSLLSGGRSTAEIGQMKDEIGVSQFFLVIDLERLYQEKERDEITERILNFTKSGEPVEGGEILYPGERTLRTRQNNSVHGIPVEPEIWQKVKSL
jgi:3-dehydro-L-gulonate 2-dehydrogenase